MAAFAHSPHSTVAFWQLSLSLRILARRTCHPFSRTIVFWQLLPIPSIRWSDFGSFSLPTSPDGRILAAFALTTYSDILPYLLFSRAIQYRQPLLTQHLTVAFWQLLLSFRILARRLCLPFSRTIAFCQLFRTRILATFALSYSRTPGTPPFWHVIPFLQLLLAPR